MKLEIWDDLPVGSMLIDHSDEPWHYLKLGRNYGYIYFSLTRKPIISEEKGMGCGYIMCKDGWSFSFIPPELFL